MQTLRLRGMVGIKGKNILVIGLARSGAGAANLLSGLGAEVTVTDMKSDKELRGYIEKISSHVRLCLGAYPDSMNGTDLIVISPGVPMNIEPVLKAKQKGIKIIGELELAYQIVKSSEFGVRSSESKPDFLAVTGTNGKSTTTTLLDLMIRKSGFRTIFGGNIGNALTEEIHKRVKGQGSRGNGQETIDDRLSSVDYIVAEVSSFQLESIDEFKPRGAAILNITPDHLDRYRNIGEYSAAKACIFMNQDGNDFLVLNADDPEIAKVENEKLKDRNKKPEIFYFSREKNVEGAYYKEGAIYFNMPGVPSSFILHPLSFRIKGVHNMENAMASSAMALLAGCPPDAVAEALKEFPGLEHRLEFVRDINGVRYINDSKGTNAGAVLKSLEGFSEPVILIAGGRDKAGDFSLLRPLIREKVKALILIGEAAGKLNNALGDLTETVTASDMKNAVYMARDISKNGDVVLLSPACASFDMFRDFEDRGNQFKKIVMELS